MSNTLGCMYVPIVSTITYQYKIQIDPRHIDIYKPDIKGISLKLLQICTSNKF